MYVDSIRLNEWQSLTKTLRQVKINFYQEMHPFSREINHAAGKQVPGDMDSEVSTAALYVKLINFLCVD
jgi:hypothetical protein